MNYYSKKLSAERLKLCYEKAPKRVKRYLKAEIEFVKSFIKSSDVILELGCGYGRIPANLQNQKITFMGIDTSCDSLLMAIKEFFCTSNFHFLR